jgi:glycosyltransferase involved in cell wall biosynthesis
MKVSVVIASYQSAHLVARAVACVLHQTHEDLECIVVDDGSTDETQRVLEQFQDPRFRVLRQENQGTAAARNTGFSAATGTWVSFLDADDLWMPDFIETSLKTARQNPHPCFVYSWYYGVNSREELLLFSPQNRVSGHNPQAAIENEGLFLPSTTLIHRDIIETLGGFETNSYLEDRVFFIRAAQHYAFYPTLKRLVLYRQSEEGRCRSILSDFDVAYQAEVKNIHALQPYLSSETLSISHIQYYGLYQRFIMYGYLDSARKLKTIETWPTPPVSLKSFLSEWSMAMNINVLMSIRRIVQFIYAFFLGPWWACKRQPAYLPVKSLEQK